METNLERQRRVAKEARQALAQAPAGLGVYAPCYKNPIEINPPWPENFSLDSKVE